jgi:hypothetical protein
MPSLQNPANPAAALLGAAKRIEQRDRQAQRNYHAKLARPTYWRWLESGGIRGSQPVPKPVRQYVRRYGEGALEDLAP